MLTDEFFLGTKLYHRQFTELCKPIIAYLGVTHAIYVNVDKNGRMFSICTHPAWVERFIEEQYYKLDPLMVHPNNIHNGFSFDIAYNEREFKDTLLYDAIIKFNWCHSFAYIEKTTQGGYFGFDFGTTKDNYKIINRLINETQIVKKTIRALHKKLLLLVNNFAEKTMDFATLKGEQFHSQQGLVFNEGHETQSKIQLLNATGFLDNSENLLADVTLSPQEINCLRAYISSRSIKLVAMDLNLALTTVASYLENIKIKLNCNNKNQLLEKGEILESLGYI